MFKRIINVFLVILMLFCFSSCGQSENSIETVISNQSQQEFEKEEKTVLFEEMQSTGQIPYDNFSIVGNSYDYYQYGNLIEHLDSNIFRFYYNSKYGYADSTGKIIISEQFKYALPFSEGKAIVGETDKNYYVIDMQGNKIFTIPEKYKSNCQDVYFQNGKLILINEPVYVNQKINVLVINKDLSTSEFNINGGKNIKTKVISTPEFCGVIIAYQNYPSKEYFYGIYDTTGKEVWSATLPSNELSSSGVANKFYNAIGSAGYYSAKINNDIEVITAENGYINIFDSNSKWGLIDLKTKEMIIPCKYDYVGAYSDGVVPICSYDKWSCVDLNDTTVIEANFKYIGMFTNDRTFAITNENKLCIINKKGEIVANPEITLDVDDINYLYPFTKENDIAIIQKGYKDSVYYTIDRNGNILTICDGKNLFISKSNLFSNNKMHKIK